MFHPFYYYVCLSGAVRACIENAVTPSVPYKHFPVYSLRPGCIGSITPPDDMDVYNTKRAQRPHNYYSVLSSSLSSIWIYIRINTWRKLLLGRCEFVFRQIKNLLTHNCIHMYHGLRFVSLFPSDWSVDYFIVIAHEFEFVFNNTPFVTTFIASSCCHAIHLACKQYTVHVLACYGWKGLRTFGRNSSLFVTTRSFRNSEGYNYLFLNCYKIISKIWRLDVQRVQKLTKFWVTACSNRIDLSQLNRLLLILIVYQLQSSFKYNAY